MHFGLIFYSGSPPGRPVPAGRQMAALLDQAVLAEELGYDHLWTAGHPATDAFYPAQFPLLAAMAARTRRIRIGTYIVALPLYHPLQVAEEAVTLDALSDGRFDLGLGVGNFVNDFAAYGVSRGERGSRMEEGLAIISGLWTQENFAFEGRHFRIPPMTLYPRPVQRALPLWVAATVPQAFDRAARYGAHLAGTGTGYDFYADCLRRHGRDPAQYRKGILEFYHLADTREEAWTQAEDAVHHFLEHYQARFSEHADFAGLKQALGGTFFGVDPVPPATELRHAPVLHFLGSPIVVGAPDAAIRDVERARSLGVTDMVIQMDIAGMEPRLVERSMQLFAREVLPRFRD